MNLSSIFDSLIHLKSGCFECPSILFSIRAGCGFDLF